MKTAIFLNDVHSGLNPSPVAAIARPRSTEDLVAAIRQARSRGLRVSMSGGRHAMGGQQFGAGSLHVATSALDRIVLFDPVAGEVEAEAGIRWPALVRNLVDLQAGEARQWGIVQKQTGADGFSLGGSLGANIHGRGLRLRPFVGDVEAFTLVDPEGEVRRCSRAENADLFRLAIGGYGLFGAVATVRLRLAPRAKLERVVGMVDVSELACAFGARIAEGFLYGDFQFAIDPGSDDFLRRGVFSCYRPLAADAPISPTQRELSADDWRELLYLAHCDRARAFETYSRHYLATSGQVYWSDLGQLSLYLDGYHRDLDRRLGRAPATEMITEIYVPRPALADFLAAAARDFRRHAVDLVYGTVRLIERDDETVLAWAREPWACVVLNLCCEHSAAGLARAEGHFRQLIDVAIDFGGSYYLTYHRFASREQVEACHPRFVEFLRRKRELDPTERFSSDWYRHYRNLFADRL